MMVHTPSDTLYCFNYFDGNFLIHCFHNCKISKIRIYQSDVRTKRVDKKNNIG